MTEYRIDEKTPDGTHIVMHRISSDNAWVRAHLPGRPTLNARVHEAVEGVSDFGALHFGRAITIFCDPELARRLEPVIRAYVAERDAEAAPAERVTA